MNANDRFTEREVSRPGGAAFVTARQKAAWLVAVGAATFACLSGATLLAGCGSSDGRVAAPLATNRAAATSSATLSIAWPARTVSTSRVIPVAANSLVATFTLNGAVALQKTIARPTDGTTSTVGFDSLTPGIYTVSVVAYPNADGSGVALASASVSVTIVSGVNGPIAISLNSTVDHLTVTPTNETLAQGYTYPLTVTAFNASGGIIPLSTGKVTFTPVSTSVVTVDDTGLVTAVGAGSTSILVTDTESGKTVTVLATVNAPPTPTPTPVPIVVAISPSSVNMPIGGTQTFTAVVANAKNAGVVWSATDGTITSDGVFTAPYYEETVFVTATSVQDPTVSATATVTVQSGGSLLIIQ